MGSRRKREGAGGEQGEEKEERYLEGLRERKEQEESNEDRSKNKLGARSFPGRRQKSIPYNTSRHDYTTLVNASFDRQIAFHHVMYASMH